MFYCRFFLFFLLDSAYRHGGAGAILIHSAIQPGVVILFCSCESELSRIGSNKADAR